MPSQRQERVSRQILQEISAIAERDLADPRLALVTFTEVRMTPDLKVAWVYYSCMPGSEGQEQTEPALEKAAGLLRRELGRRLSLRYVPDLRFRYDDSMERARRISELLDVPGGREDADDDGGGGEGEGDG